MAVRQWWSHFYYCFTFQGKICLIYEVSFSFKNPGPLQNTKKYIYRHEKSTNLKNLYLQIAGGHNENVLVKKDNDLDHSKI